MSGGTTVTIGGVAYDADTGMPIRGEAKDAPLTPSAVKKEVKRVAALHSGGIHKRPAKSQTLNRSFVKKAAPEKKAPRSNPNGSMDMKRSVRPKVARSPMVTKFAPVAASAHASRPNKPVQVSPVAHPVVTRAVAKAPHASHHTNVAKPVAHVPAAEIKRTAIADALDNAKPASAHKKKTSKKSRHLSVASAALGVLLLAGYFTYLNMPNLSVRVAAAQAGIDAKYPEYHPVGYRLDGPVAYRDGEVNMRFASNSGPSNFSLSQTKSAWDSSALLENFVNPESEGRYATYSDAGLTIYTYGNSAAWVNAGILYTVDGSATLSGEQVRRMATSL